MRDAVCALSSPKLLTHQHTRSMQERRRRASSAYLDSVFGDEWREVINVQVRPQVVHIYAHVQLSLLLAECLTVLY